MENQTIPDYETIRAAVAGQKWAVEKVVACYAEEIDRLSTVTVKRPDGSTKQEVNEDMRQSITKKLIEALPQFPLEELEKQNRK
ncbi:helix-turn-helix domain-containing protein [Clostridioides difficile]|nr:helix-turn-helix domain-containing protein [Clostridioides difficile]MDN9434834.1 helix-turn-helix domain-containing protein [Clostridioides difficile]